MTYDLHERLRDLERTAPLGALDVTAIELGARRHRRGLVARRAGGAAVLVVVAVVAVTLGGRAPEPRSAPPAGPSGDAAHAPHLVECGAPAPAPRSSLAVVVPVVQIEGPDDTAQGKMTTVVALVNNAGEPLVLRERAAVTFLVDAEGRVVQKRSRTVQPDPMQMPDHGWNAIGEGAELRACDGSLLPDGDYTLHAAFTLRADSADDPFDVVGGGLPVAVRDGWVEHDPPTGSADLRLTLKADPDAGYGLTVDRGSVPDGLLVLRAQVVSRDAAGSVVGGSFGTSLVVPAGEPTGEVVVPGSVSMGGPEVDSVDRVARTDVVVTGYVLTDDGEQRVVSGAVDVRQQSTS